MELVTESAFLEAILFLEREAASLERLTKISAFSEEVVKICIENLKEKYQKEESGLTLSYIDGKYQLIPKKCFWEALSEKYEEKKEARLSRSALETLSIIAYRQPITRAEIEAIRGVAADGMIRKLLEMSLIRETGKRAVPGNPGEYGTSEEFLRFFALASIKDLPPLSKEEEERFSLSR